MHSVFAFKEGIRFFVTLNFNAMKINIIILLDLLIIQPALSQTGAAYDDKSDPFCKMIRAVYAQDALSFHSQLKIKQLFETDTVSSNARVTVIKKGTDISFLRIIPDDGDKELLFCHDSAWLVDHLNREIDCFGTTTGDLAHNYMSQFFPFTLFNLDTVISQVNPFWKVISRSKEFTVISLNMAGSSKDISDARVEFSCYNASSLPYRTLQESVYMKADKLYQEQIFSGYTYPCPNRIKIPDYFLSYSKDISALTQTEGHAVTDEEETGREVFLDEIELSDLSGIPVRLPDKGLILFDLWYAGCPPCMQSAPAIENLYRQYKDSVHFFSVNEIDTDTAKISRFREMMGISFPVLLGAKEKLAIKVNCTGGYPVFILMDAASRKVIWKFVGYTGNLETVIKDAIRSRL